MSEIRILAMMGAILCALPTNAGQVLPHFDGERFHNAPPSEDRDFFDVMRFLWTRIKPEDPLKKDPALRAKPSPVNHSNKPIVTLVGHATVLLQAGGLNILTDPIWSERCSPVSFLGPKRFQAPGIHFDDLPPIDAVLISHNHYDHMDLPTLKRLWLRDQPTFIVPLKNGDILKEQGITNIVEQNWWQEVILKNKVKVTAVPAQHWSGRMIIDRNKALWAGFVISFADHHVYFAGDTGFGPHLAAIKQKFGHFELALLPIGAFLPLWFMTPHHMSPADAIKAAEILQAKRTIPIHFGTFSLGDDGIETAEKELKNLLKQNKRIDFTILKPGQSQG